MKARGILSCVKTITTNAVTKPQWQGLCQLAVNVNLQVPVTVTNYTLWFFNAGYPKAEDPFAPDTLVSSVEGAPAGGTISYSGTPASLNYGDGSTDPMIYSCADMAASGGGSGATGFTVPNPGMVNDPAYPDIGD
jgi:hypothetical protein